MLRTIVDMTFLLLAVIIIVVLLKDVRGRELVNTARNDVAIVRQDLEKVMVGNIQYLESRVNKSEERQDSYQSSTSRRLRVIEDRLASMEKNKNQKIINNNFNNNTLTNNNK